MTFRVGMKVVCIKAAQHPGWAGHYPSVKGRIYTIREVYTSPVTGRLGLRFQEHVNPLFLGIECGYSADRFRPVVERKTDISVFTAMLNPSKQKVRA